MNKLFIVTYLAVALSGCSTATQTAQTNLPQRVISTVDCNDIAAKLIDRNWPLYRVTRADAIKEAVATCEYGVNAGTKRATDFNTTIQLWDDSDASTKASYISAGYPPEEAEKSSEIMRSARYAGFMSAIEGNTNYKIRWNCDLVFDHFWQYSRPQWRQIPKGEAQQYSAAWCERGRQDDIASQPDTGADSYYYTVKSENDAIRAKLIGKGWTLADADAMLSLRMNIVSMVRLFEREKEYWHPAPVSKAKP